MIKHDNILRFDNLAKFDNLVHGFSTKHFGDTRYSHEGHEEAIQKFTGALSIDSQKIVKLDQMHTNNIYLATAKDCNTKIENTDGIITKDLKVFLAVITADCLPLLFYDPTKKIVSAVHAGWRGLFAEIIKEAISGFVSKDSSPEDLIVGIGPSIRVCCYEVSEEFVERFREKFEDVEKFVIRRSGKIFFDLQKVAKEQLLAAGVSDSNIEDAGYCTFTQEDVYSCRREGEGFGEMMGIIGQTA